MLDIKEVRAFARKHNLTEAQLDILRRAAAKWKYKPTPYDKIGILNDCAVPMYGTRQDSLDILQARGLIVNDYVVRSEADRLAKEEKAKALIFDAFLAARNTGPFEVSTSGKETIPNWKGVLIDLRVANAELDNLKVRGLFITESGMAIAKEWKMILGATEE